MKNALTRFAAALNDGVVRATSCYGELEIGGTKRYEWHCRPISLLFPSARKSILARLLFTPGVVRFVSVTSSQLLL